jgi:hypothetical protein
MMLRPDLHGIAPILLRPVEPPLLGMVLVGVRPAGEDLGDIGYSLGGGRRQSRK